MTSLRSLLLCGMLVAPALNAAPQADPSDDFPYPTAYVMDIAHVLPPGADERLSVRLKQLYFASHEKVSLNAYTLRSARWGSPETVEQDLMRAWGAMPNIKDYADEVAVLFVFADERETRIFLGKSAPKELVTAVQGIEPQRVADVTQDVEPVLMGIIDRIAANLGIPATYHDPPPVPAATGESIVGKPGTGAPLQTGNAFTDADLKTLATALEGASHEAGHPIVLVLNPETGLFSPQTISANLTAARPDTTLLILFQTTGEAFLRPASSFKGLFSEESIGRIEGDLHDAMAIEKNNGHGRLGRTLTRTVGEIGAIAGGHPPSEFTPQLHPLLMLAGGQDADWHDGIIPALFLLAFLILFGFWFAWFIKDPVGALVGLVFFAVEGALGGGGGGGGGGSSGGGGGFSGGGGSSGGGGASGSW
jgi:uncharacterized membrane protein YgcG